MDFEISDERRMLGDSLGRLLDEACGFEHRTGIAYAEPWHDPELWQALSELGIFYAFLPEEAGGIGGAGFDVTCVFEPLGRALCPEPVLGQLMGLRLLAAAGAEVEAALGGGERLALGVGEPDAPYGLEEITAQAVPVADGWQLSGRKSVVYGVGSATRVLVAARHEGGIGLFDLAPEAAEITAYGMIDGGGAGEVLLQDSPATCLIEDVAEALELALDFGRLALAAEAIGAAEAALALTTDYLKTRQQFGRPLATFQALQHRLVDLAIELEQARSITIRAAAAMDGPERARAVAQAKNLIGRAAQQIAEESIQMHGGIAMTWEYPVSHYAKRLTMIDAQLGDADWQLDRLAGL